MKKTKTVLLIFAGLLIFACKTAPPHTEKSLTGSAKTGETKTITALIGQLHYEGEGFDEFAGISLNGSADEGLYVIIENIDSGEIFVSITKQNGLFIEPDLLPGLYSLSQLVYSIPAGGDYITTAWKPIFPLEFSLEEGKLNNIGYLYWGVEYDWYYADTTINNCYYNYMYEIADIETEAAALELKNMERTDIFLIEKGETMLIGTVGLEISTWMYTIQEFDSDYDYKGIQIFFVDFSTGKEYRTRTGHQGIFTFIDVPAGYYTLKEIKFEWPDGDWAIWSAPDGMDFPVVQGSVNNLGMLDWYIEFDLRNGGETVNNLTYNNNYDVLMDWFLAEFAGAKWSSRNWTNTEIN